MSKSTDQTPVIIAPLPRRRKTKALPESTGVGGNDLEASTKKDILNADAPDIGFKTMKDRVAMWVQLRATDPDITTKEISVRLGLQPRTLYSYIARATREGWLKFDHPMDKLEYELIPKTVDVLNAHLDRGDKTVAIEMAKGTLFKQYQESKGISQVPNNVLALKIELPEGTVQVATGHIVGSPKVYEDEPE